MSNDLFEHLRRKLTLTYASVSILLILIIVGSAYYMVWRSILDHEKELLVKQIYHEAEEWVEAGEAPCSDVAIREGSLLAYFVEPDGQRVILDQLGDADVGKTLLRKRDTWPKENDTARMLRLHGGEGGDVSVHYRYLAAVAPVVKDGVVEGRLYMFKDMSFYYDSLYRTLFWLFCLSCVLFAGACSLGWMLAWRNILPIRHMYERQQQFTADASHEMRTPLAVLKLATEGMEADDESQYSDFAKESLAMVHGEVEHMTRLTDELMTLARSDDGTLPHKLERVDVSALCRKLAERMQLLCVEKQMSLRCEIADGLYAEGDEHALNRLLVIFLDNAMKYSPTGTQLTLAALAKGSKLVLQVRDEGMGISDADKKHIFDRFFRVDKARSRSAGGLGLGLSLALAIVQQHGGSIRVLDNKPCGTIMQVELPRKGR